MDNLKLPWRLFAGKLDSTMQWLVPLSTLHCVCFGGCYWAMRTGSLRWLPENNARDANASLWCQMHTRGTQKPTFHKPVGYARADLSVNVLYIIQFLKYLIEEILSIGLYLRVLRLQLIKLIITCLTRVTLPNYAPFSFLRVLGWYESAPFCSWDTFPFDSHKIRTLAQRGWVCPHRESGMPKKSTSKQLPSLNNL